MNTYISDNLTALKEPPTGVYNAQEGTDLSITSTTWADLDGTADKFNKTITTTGGDVLVSLRAAGIVTTGNNILYLDVSIDGVAEGVTTFGSAEGLHAVYFNNAGANVEASVAFLHLCTGVSAGSHAFKIRYKVATGANAITLYRGAGTASGDITPQFFVREI